MKSDRIFVGMGGLAGAAGVALAARAAHGGGAFTQTISTMLLLHAPLFVALGLSAAAQANKVLKFAGLLLMAGLAVFCLDLYVRDMGAARLFPFAAPVGGSAMILGWLGVALSALAARR